MANRSDAEAQSLQEIAEYHQDAADSLKMFFSTPGEIVELRYLFFSEAELSAVLAMRLRETEVRSCLAILTSMEAALRLDYQTRCSAKLKDPLSRDFRKLFKEYQERVSLEDDILQIWSENHPDLKQVIGELRGALKFRHWLAHGRYWELTRGRKYDFTEIYLLASIVHSSFPMVSA